MTEPVPNINDIPLPTLVTGVPVMTSQVDDDDVIEDMEAFREQGIEGMGGKGIKFRPGGRGTEVFTVPHPLLLEDYQHKALSKSLSTPDIAEVLLNTTADPGVYDRFQAAGGRSGDVMIAWRRLGEGLGAPKSGKR